MTRPYVAEIIWMLVPHQTANVMRFARGARKECIHGRSKLVQRRVDGYSRGIEQGLVHGTAQGRNDDLGGGASVDLRAHGPVGGRPFDRVLDGPAQVSVERGHVVAQKRHRRQRLEHKNVEGAHLGGPALPTRVQFRKHRVYGVG
jgi:hypothetical protein